MSKEYQVTWAAVAHNDLKQIVENAQRAHSPLLGAGLASEL